RDSTRPLCDRSPRGTSEMSLVRLLSIAYSFGRMRPPYESSEDLVVLNRYSASKSELSRLSEQGMRTLSMLVDGWDIHLYLSDGRICGGEPNLHNLLEEYREQRPYLPCLKDDGSISCGYDLLSARSLRADHLFVDSCSSLLPVSQNPHAPTPGSVNVAMSFLAGFPSSYVSSYRIKDGRSEECFLYSALAKYGYDLGSITKILNVNSRQVGLELDPFVLVGDPNRRITTPRGATLTETAAQPTPGGVVVEIASGGCRLVDTIVDTHGLGALAARHHLAVSWYAKRLPRSSYFLAIPHGPDAVRLLVYATAPLPPIVRLELEGVDPWFQELQRCNAVIKNLDSLMMLRNSDSKLRGIAADLRG
ncbi:hypothetical protein B1B_09640, partial [mine drainage metagenome]